MTATGAATAIETAVRDYLDGMVYGDEAKLRRAFHRDARVVGHFGGTLEWSSVDEFAAGCIAADTPPPGTDYFWQIRSLKIDGDTAVVELVDDYLGIRFTDWLSFLHHDGRWVIVNKLFYAHPQG
jgi:hypothetical protein